MAFFTRFKRRRTGECDPEHAEITARPKNDEVESISSPSGDSLFSPFTVQPATPGTETVDTSLVEMMSVDDDFLVFRRFGALSARVMLDMQSELERKEAELQSLDRKYGGTQAMDFEKDERVNLLAEIKFKLKEYSTISRNIFLALDFDTDEAQMTSSSPTKQSAATRLSCHGASTSCKGLPRRFSMLPSQRQATSPNPTTSSSWLPSSLATTLCGSSSGVCSTSLATVYRRHHQRC
jgi:hypothetical protein